MGGQSLDPHIKSSNKHKYAFAYKNNAEIIQNHILPSTFNSKHTESQLNLNIKAHEVDS